MSSPAALQPLTSHSERATMQGALIEAALNTRLGALAPVFTFAVSAVEASTGGGVRVLQHMQLVASGKSLVIGHVDTKRRVAELRGVDHVIHVNARRLPGPLPIEAAAYEGFLVEARNVLTELGFAITMRSAPATPEPAVHDVRARVSAWTVGLSISFVVAAFAAVVMAVH